MNKVILVRYGEIALKGLNKSSFEIQLIKNIKSAIRGLGKFDVVRSQSRIYVQPEGEVDLEPVIRELQKVFGIVSISIVSEIKSDFEEIKKEALRQAQKLFDEGNPSFKVESRRGDKTFQYNSQELNYEIGGFIFNSIHGIKVDVHNPSFMLYIEVRENTYVYSEIIKCAGGMPVGTNGKAALLLSGGIDSPAAGYMIAKRGVIIDAIHFHSFPYTSERAKQKVVDLARILAGFTGRVNLYVVSFTKIQQEIYQKCPEDELTLIMRRFMMKIAERLAVKGGASALITGESIGQVASQTMESLCVTNNAVSMPVFRPLIGMDKIEIIEIARKIDTYETSILPYEDCCTVFVPKHPKTHPKLENIIQSENILDVEGLINEAVEGVEVIKVER